MDDASSEKLNEISKAPVRANELVRQYVRDPLSPRPSEVHRLVVDLARHLSQLDRQNRELRETQRQLENYRDRYIDLYDAAPLGYASLDEEGYVQEINLAGAKLLGVDRNAMTGYSFTDFVVEEDRKAFLEHLRRCVRQRCEATSELRLVGAGGQTITTQFRSIPIVGPHEETLCKTAITDITQRRKMEETLRRTQFAVDHAADAIFWVGPDAHIEYANACACRRLGYTGDEMLSLSVHDIDPNFPAEVWPDHWEELKRQGSFTFESQHRAKDGHLLPVEITVNYLAFAGKEYDCAFVRDIAERKCCRSLAARKRGAASRHSRGFPGRHHYD